MLEKRINMFKKTERVQVEKKKKMAAGHVIMKTKPCGSLDVKSESRTAKQLLQN